MSQTFVPRVLVARPGADGQDRAGRALVARLRGAGFEASHAGRAEPAAIAAAAVGEAADVLLLTLAAGDHLQRCQKIREELRARGAPDLPLVVVGALPASDHPLLASCGVRRVLGPGEPAPEVARFLSWLLEPKAVIARGWPEITPEI